MARDTKKTKDLNQSLQNKNLKLESMDKAVSENVFVKGVNHTDYDVVLSDGNNGVVFPHLYPLREGENQLLLQAIHLFMGEIVQYDTALYEIAKFASTAFNANCQIRLFSDARDALILSAIHNNNPEIFQGENISLEDFTLNLTSDGLDQVWLDENIPLLIREVKRDTDFKGMYQYFWPFEKQHPLQSLMVFPLQSGEESMGILILIRYELAMEKFSNTDFRFARQISEIAADAISLAQKYTTIQDQLFAQKKKIKALENSEQRFRQVFESSTDAIFICQQNGIIVDANLAALQTYGYARDELVNQEISVISFDYLSLNFSAEKSDLSEFDGAPFECLTRQKNGESIYTEVIVQPFSQGKKAFYQINTRDISERVQTQNKLKKQMNHLHAIRAIDLVMKNSAELRSILEFILNQIKLELEVDAVALLLLDDTETRLECISAQGFKTKLEQNYFPDMNTSYAGKIVKDHKIIYRNYFDVQKANRFPKFLTTENMKSYCGVPLMINEKIKGVIEAFSKDKFDFNYDWINYLETLAGHAAIAIENYQLFSELKQSNEEVVRAYDATIAGWSHALDLRDNETEGHTERVAEMTVALAKEAGYTEEEILHIRRGALLHDIGKIGIPDSILLKPGKLDDDEWEIMKKHPQYAYDMLCDIEYLRPALDIPLYHHEKWDGTGYPRGLAGDEIPFTARLFAVVDVWDALRSDRPYREKWVDERVYLYIKEKNGSHFDPQAVELFLKVAKNKVW